MSPRLMVVPVEAIRPNPHQPRREFDDEALDALARSLEKHGLLQPISIVVRTGEDGPYYELVAGERRLRAAKRLGWTTIRAMVLEPGEVGDQATLAIAENTVRKDLNRLELIEAVARVLGVPRSELKWMTNRLRIALRGNPTLEGAPEELRRLKEVLEDLNVSFEYWRKFILPVLEWPKEVQEAALEGKIPWSVAEVVARFPPYALEKALEAAIAGASVRDLRRVLRKTSDGKTVPNDPVRDPVTQAYLAFFKALRKMQYAMEEEGAPKELIKEVDRIGERYRTGLFEEILQVIKKVDDWRRANSAKE